jgi:hypothetical protein
MNLFMKTRNKSDFRIDEIWVVPCGTRPDKPNDLPPKIRLEMTQLALKDFFPRDVPIKIDPVEVDNGQSIPTAYLL